jgi:hypothetical protein
MISSYDAHNKRLLIVTNVFPPQIIGGAEIVAQRQAVALAKLGFSVYVLRARLAIIRLILLTYMPKSLMMFRYFVLLQRRLVSKNATGASIWLILSSWFSS